MGRSPDSGSASTGSDSLRAQARISSASATVSQEPSPASTKEGRFHNNRSMASMLEGGNVPARANKRAQIETGTILRGDTGVASAQSEAVVGGTRMACRSAPAKSGLSGASKGKFTCTGPARCMQAREATCRFGS